MMFCYQTWASNSLQNLLKGQEVAYGNGRMPTNLVGYKYGQCSVLILHITHRVKVDHFKAFSSKYSCDRNKDIMKYNNGA